MRYGEGHASRWSDQSTTFSVSYQFHYCHKMDGNVFPKYFIHHSFQEVLCGLK